MRIWNSTLEKTYTKRSHESTTCIHTAVFHIEIENLFVITVFGSVVIHSNEILYEDISSCYDIYIYKNSILCKEAQ